MEPGNVAAVLKSTSVLDGLLNITDGLANLLQSFIPIIKDSQTSSVPCGGAVRAENLTDSQCVRGLAGGYVGYNHGGRILGNASADGKEYAAIRIRSVYGAEFFGRVYRIDGNSRFDRHRKLKFLVRIFADKQCTKSSWSCLSN